MRFNKDHGCTCHYCGEIISIRGEEDIFFHASGTTVFNGFINAFSLDGIVETSLEEVGQEGRYYHVSCFVTLVVEEDPALMKLILEGLAR